MGLKYKIIALALLTGCISLVCGCSPGYYLRASWEEAGILLHRQSIKKIVSTTDTDANLKRRLQLVLDVRQFTTTLGLNPKESYTKYTKIDRDVLLWALSACDKTSFTPKTWWFPFVGSVPYKGFFEKDDALQEAKKLREEGLDIYLRTSVAFSTLGWFNDPLLSTILASDDTDLVNIVIHEILHNTIWVEDHAPFNESLANFVGNIGAQEFFQSRNDEYRTLADLAANRWHDELLFAALIDKTYNKLEKLYKQKNKNKSQKSEAGISALSEKEILAKRKLIFTAAEKSWANQKPLLRGTGYYLNRLKLNNAVIIAQRIYLSELQVFLELYQASGNNLKRFIAEMKKIAKNIEDKKLEPFKAVRDHTKELTKDTTIGKNA